MDSKLKKCPFCKGKNIKIVITDDEGNIHNESYEDDPYSGLWYSIAHFSDKHCPIAFWKDDIGDVTYSHRYTTREAAIAAWNRRADHIPQTVKMVEFTREEWAKYLFNNVSLPLADCPKSERKKYSSPVEWEFKEIYLKIADAIIAKCEGALKGGECE